MEILFIAIVSLCMAALLNALFNLSSSTSRKKLPPGPVNFPFLGNIFWMRHIGREDYLRKLLSKYGPIFSIKVGPKLAIFISNHTLAYETLIKNGLAVSDRPGGVILSPIFGSQSLSTISSSSYGPNWKILRKNLLSEIMHPVRIKSYTRTRQWVLENLLENLKRQSVDGCAVTVMKDFRFAMFSLLVFMCFGEKLGENEVKDIERVSHDMLSRYGDFDVLNYWPRLGQFIFFHKWVQLIRLRKNQDNVIRPLIQARRNFLEEEKLNSGGEKDDSPIVAYIDTLFDLELPEKKRKANEFELVSLCNEFIDGGTDTTTTVLEWIMANLVKYPEIQAKVYDELSRFVGDGSGHVGEIIKEEDLPKLVYLKAVILEGLRRHPPGHFIVPHRLTDEVEINGYVLPKDASLNVLVMEVNKDPTVWEDPMEFRPERFLSEGGGVVDFDLKGSRGVKMMSFGVGRRICPGMNLAMVHLGYFIANLVWNFEWVATEEGVDFSENHAFTVVMKNHLKVRLIPRGSVMGSS
ncbi:cytochrome P450 89A2-like [Impatiens glandulifera]|uniref:cytochrome P450 89A2-like n=1 Tax=Impatiens glandulifera TaxID=253017 RepID=UPI001FB0F40C|nr:cytochrome P450 89A2-like [Impatiens glandulifera]